MVKAQKTNSQEHISISLVCELDRENELILFELAITKIIAVRVKSESGFLSV